MRRPEKVPAGANLGDGVQRKAGVGNGEGFKVGIHHLQHFRVQDQLLETRRQPAVHPARRVVQQMRPAQHRPPDRHLRFIGGLRVHVVGGGHIG